MHKRAGHRHHAQLQLQRPTFKGHRLNMYCRSASISLAIASHLLYVCPCIRRDSFYENDKRGLHASGRNIKKKISKWAYLADCLNSTRKHIEEFTVPAVNLYVFSSRLLKCCDSLRSVVQYKRAERMISIRDDKPLRPPSPPSFDISVSESRNIH